MRKVPFVIMLLLLALCVFSQASTGNTKTSKQKSRVFLIHADELFFDIWKNNNAQVLRGHVEFEHDGAHLYCDSAN